MRFLVVLTALAALATGCGELQRVRECRALARAVNGALDDVETAVQSKSPAGYQSAARRYQELVSEVEGLPLSAAGGEDARRGYLEAMRPIPAAVEAYAGSAASKRGGEPLRNQRELERLARRERLAANKLNAYCRAH